MGAFKAASERALGEAKQREVAKLGLLHFGIPFLDDALFGISPNDLILLGAPSGIGKTQLCCQIALANIEDGKRVHYIALEAEPMEIERRIKYQIFAAAFTQLSYAITKGRKPTYRQWLFGEYVKEYADLEGHVSEFFEKGYGNLFTYYKTGDFGVPQMIELVVSNAKDADLFIIDHVHYFDFDDDNENRAIREIAKTARMLALEESKPIILVSHLRKRDKANIDLASGLDEFMGSSDLPKIATKVITLAPGGITTSGKYETFFRIPKNRQEGSVTRYLGRVHYDAGKSLYDREYKIGLAHLTRTTGFEELAHDRYPEWARSVLGGGNDTNAKG